MYIIKSTHYNQLFLKYADSNAFSMTLTLEVAYIKGQVQGQIYLEGLGYILTMAFISIWVYISN